MSLIDLLILIGYFTFSLIIGLTFHNKTKTRDDYLLAGRSMGWLPVGLSIMVTAFSAINITAFSGEVLSYGLYALMSIPVFYLVSIPVKRVIIPFFHGLNITSAYEYLEIRYDRKVRQLAALMFVLWRILWIATVIYIPSRILSGMSGISLNSLILITGSIATLYTFWGGIRAVIWTDVIQFIVMITGLIASVVFVIHLVPDGIHGIIQTALPAGLLKPFKPFDVTIFSFDPRIRISFWSAIIGTFIAFLTRYGADQVVIQRYLTAKNLAQAQKGFTLNYLAAIASILLLGFLGLAIHAYFIQQGEIPQYSMLPINYFTRFVNALPPGINGLMITAIIAASMSSFDSGIHSCSTVFSVDFQNLSFFKKISPQVLTLILGVLITVTALYIKDFGSVFEIANKIVNGFGSPLLALFIMGKYSRNSSSFGAFTGGIAGLLFSSCVILFVKNLALHYYAVVNFIGTIGFIYIFSAIRNQARPAPSN